MRTSQGWGDACVELADYFRTTESVNGLASSWESLAGIAQGGAVTSKDPEARFIARLGEGGRRVVALHREVRATLLRLPAVEPRTVDVLWAVYGPVPWGSVVKQGLGEETLGKLAEYLDARLYGVALLTPEFREGSRDWAGPQPLKKDDHRDRVLAWRVPGAWIADLAVVAKSRGKRVSEERRASAVATLSEIGRSATRILRASEDVYRVMRGKPGDGACNYKPRRARRVEGLDGVDFNAGGGR